MLSSAKSIVDKHIKAAYFSEEMTEESYLMLYSPKSINNPPIKIELYNICLLERAEVASTTQMLFVLVGLWHSGQEHHVKGSL